MRVVCVNYAYDPRLTSPDELLNHYVTLTDWAEALRSAGAEVSVVQRFHLDAQVIRGGVPFLFVRDPAIRHGSLLDWPRRTHRAVVARRPDIVQVNGLQLARQAWLLKRALPGTPVVLQDHAGRPPTRRISLWTLRFAMRRLDAVSFVAREQARPWIEGGFLRADTAVLEIQSATSSFCFEPRVEARARTGLQGDPLCLWVGRLNANKDPITVLRGFAAALPRLPDARLAMIYSADDLLPQVKAWLAERPSVAGCVNLLGWQPHATLEALYNSADFFLLGSHHEGSGYAVLEALSCGVTPIITDIPSFRALTENSAVGALWPVEDSEALACALIEHNTRRRPDSPQQVRAWFEERFSLESIGRKALAAYAGLLYPHMTQKSADEYTDGV